MKLKIKQITLLDGKQLFYPTEEEVKKLSDLIASVIVEETMTKEEYYRSINSKLFIGWDVQCNIESLKNN